MNLLEQQQMNRLSAEIIKINHFAQSLYVKKGQENDKVIQFLICLDFLVKGVLSHW